MTFLIVIRFSIKHFFVSEIHIPTLEVWHVFLSVRTVFLLCRLLAVQKMLHHSCLFSFLIYLPKYLRRVDRYLDLVFLLWEIPHVERIHTYVVNIIIIICNYYDLLGTCQMISDLLPGFPCIPGKCKSHDKLCTNELKKVVTLSSLRDIGKYIRFSSL